MLSGVRVLPVTRISTRSRPPGSRLQRCMATDGSLYPHNLHSLSQSHGFTMKNALARLGSRFEEVPLIGGTSNFVRPSSLLYELDGKQRRWDAIESHSSIGVVVYHTDLKHLLVVRQFRPPVYAVLKRAAAAAASSAGELSPPPDLALGFTYELCAGILDKDKSVLEVTSEEIAEELGYKVSPDSIKALGPAIASAGTSGAQHFMFYAEVNESMRASAGGGLVDHGELIEVLGVPVDSVESFVMDPTLNKSPGLMFGLLWAFHALKSGQIGRP